MKMKLLVCMACLAIMLFQSCDYNALPEPQTDSCDGAVSFSDDVQPIINRSCAISGCHNGDNGADKNWTVLANLQAKKNTVKDRITRPVGTPGHMPAIPPELTIVEIQQIVCWVDQGALDN